MSIENVVLLDSGQDEKQFICIKLNDKDTINVKTSMLTGVSANTITYNTQIGQGLLGQISAVALLKSFSRPLNSAYKNHYTFRLSSKRNINIQNEFMAQPYLFDNPNDRSLPPIKDLSYIFSAVNTGLQDGKLVNSELITGQEVELSGGCSIINKPLTVQTIEVFGGIEPFLMILTRISTSEQLKYFFSTFYKLIMNEKACLTSIFEKKLVKALVGFLEPLSDLLDENIQEIFADFMTKDIDNKLRVQFVKYLFLDLNFVYKTPLSFQHFASRLVLQIYKRPELAMHQYISLDWMIKYLTIYSILDSVEEPKEPVSAGISPFRTSTNSNLDENQVRERVASTPQNFNYAVEIIKGIVTHFDFKEPWIEEGIDILLKCLCYPNLSYSIQVDYLHLVRLVLDSPIFDWRYQYRFIPIILPSLQIFFRNTLYPKNRSYVVNLLNLLNRKTMVDLYSVCATISDILDRRPFEADTSQADSNSFKEWNNLLNNLSRFMLNIEPDFSRQNRNFIEEGARVVNPEVLNVVYEISSKVDQDNKQKIIQDLIMLFGFDPQNAVTTFKKSYFIEWIIDVLVRAEKNAIENEEDIASRGLCELSAKLLSLFLSCMAVYSSFDRVVYYKFVAGLEERILRASKDAVSKDESYVLKHRISRLRAKIMTGLLETATKEPDRVKQAQSQNYFALAIRSVNYLFSFANVQEIDEKIKQHETDDNQESTPEYKTPTPSMGLKKFSWISEPTKEDLEDDLSPKTNMNHFLHSDMLSVVDRCYQYERYKRFARFDERTRHWLDEPVFEAIKKFCCQFLPYNNIEELISDVNEGKNTFPQDLLFRNKQEKGEPRLLSSIIVAMMFGVDWSIEIRNCDKLRDNAVFMERLFASVYALDEIERKNLKKPKYRYLDSILILILYFLSDRRNRLMAETQKNEEMIEILSKTKNKIWKGLILTLKFDKMDKLLNSKDSGGLMKVFSAIKNTATAKVYSFVDDLFFKKFVVTDIKKDVLKKNVERVYGNEDFFKDFPDKVKQSENIRSLFENHLVSEDAVRSEFTTRADTVNEIIKSIAEHVSTERIRKKRKNKLRNELEEKMVEMHGSLEENFMSSVINAEMIVRDCRNKAHTVLYQQRDINGMWAHFAELRKYNQIDTPFNPSTYEFSQEKNKYYHYELNSWFSHKFSRPFLSFKLQKYWTDGHQEQDSEKDACEMNIFDRGSNKNRKIKKKQVATKLRRNMKLFTQRIINSAATGASKLLNAAPEVEKEEDQKPQYSRSCELLNKFTIYSGMVIVTKRHIIFCTDNIKSKNYLSILNVELEKHDKVKHKWNLSDIVEIQRRRLVQRKTGIEIFFEGGYSVLINMPPDQNDVQEFHDLLMSLRESFVFQNPFSKIRSTRNVKLLEANRYTERWMAGELTNFHYLMLLNNYGGRSYHDLSQYPVFPWVTMLFKAAKIDIADELERDLLPNELDFLLGEDELLSEQGISYFQLRNLARPMGTLGLPSRLKLYKEKFESKDHFSDAPSYHYGSHYSSPAIILHYLIRLSPFTEGAKSIQNGHFDLPDRLFFSVIHTFRNAIEESSDVRELIPEFYSVPETFLNMNKLDFGVSQSGERVDCVLLPKWAQGNPYIFVYVMAKLLESTAVTLTLKNWIDLVFGYKQNGEEAEKAINTFYYLTYEDMVDLDQIKEQDRQGVETQVVHFGQTPSKLFTKPHPGPASSGHGLSRVRSVNFIEDSINIYSRASDEKEKPVFNKEMKNYHDFISPSIFRLQTTQNKRIVAVHGNQVLHWQWGMASRLPGEAIDDLDDKMPFKFTRYNKAKDVLFNFFSETGVLKEIDLTLDMLTFPTHMFEDNRVLIVGGFITGMIRLWKLDKNIYKDYLCHCDTVSVVKGDRTERILVTGSLDGMCILWDVKESDVSRKWTFCDFDSAILDVFIQDDSKIAAVSSQEGKLIIYNLITKEIFRTLFHPEALPINRLLLSLQPFGTVVFYSMANGKLYVYSVNGQLLTSKRFKASKITDLTISADSNNMDFLAFSTTTGEVGIANIPFLENFKAYQIGRYVPISSLCILPRGEAIIAGDVIGGIHILFNDSNVLLKESKGAVISSYTTNQPVN